MKIFRAAISVTLLLSVLSLSACGPTDRDKQDVVVRQLGDFHVAQVLVLPDVNINSENSRSTPEAVADFTRLLQPELFPRLGEHATGRSVDMTITVEMLHFETSTGMLLLAGDAKQVNTTILLQDSTTHEMLLNIPLLVMGERNSGGIAGIAFEAITNDTDARERENFIMLYAQRLMRSLYPPPPRS